MIDHSSCKYYYIGETKTTKWVYDSLKNKDIPIIKIEKLPCCGALPDNIVLEEEQPICSLYKEKGR